jgi:imidazolonepropionase
VVPAGITGDDYVDLVCGPMLDACAPLARWIDVFCETGAFTLEQSEQILRAGAVAGLGLRIHANQLGHSGAVRLACELDAASADHCTHLDSADIDALASTATVATLLPATEFSTRNPYPPARTLIEAGATVALASNCNPGSSFTSSMPFVIALAVTQMAMTPAEALWSATRGGARALRREDIGQLGVGSRADYAILDAPTFEHLAYRPGVQLVAEVSSSVA